VHFLNLRPGVRASPAPPVISLIFYDVRILNSLGLSPALQGRCIFLVFRSMNPSRSPEVPSFHHALDVDILQEADVAVPQYRLDGFVIDAQGVKIRREAAPEGVPAVPQKK
jgi:hypothetical protein